MKFVLLMGLCVLAIAGCTGGGKTTAPAQREATLGSPEATIERYAQALAKNDVETALGLYAPDVFKMEEITEAQARQVLRDQLSKQEVPAFSAGVMKVEKVTHYAQVDYTVGGKVRHLLLKETPDGWRISSSMIAE